MKVLLIDHEEDVRLGAQAVFELRGIACDVAPSLSHAKKSFDMSSYNKIISANEVDASQNILTIKKPYTAKQLLETAGGI